MLSDLTIRFLIMIIVCKHRQVDEYQNIFLHIITVRRYMPAYWTFLLGTQFTTGIHCIGHYIGATLPNMIFF